MMFLLQHSHRPNGKNNRVFYRIANTARNQRGIRHCEFTDNGCPACGSTGKDDIKDLKFLLIPILLLML
jgi:hypothetical protein